MPFYFVWLAHQFLQHTNGANAQAHAAVDAPVRIPLLGIGIGDGLTDPAMQVGMHCGSVGSNLSSSASHLFFLLIFIPQSPKK